MHQLKVAILDMYKGEPNQGMRNIHEILKRYAEENSIDIHKTVYDVRGKQEVPGLEYNVYISTGGPGSPVDAEGWEEAYLQLIHSIILFNETSEHKKFVFLICHSYQVVCYHFKLAKVCLRKSESFGTFPIHKTADGERNNYLKNLPEPFYAVDSRKWQVIQPNKINLKIMGAKVVAIEKARAHIPLERATMAIQFTPEIFGTQFHPEADAAGMIFYLNGEEKKKVVIENYGIKKYNEMMFHLHDPDKIMLTQRIILPSFLDAAVDSLKIKSAVL